MNTYSYVYFKNRPCVSRTGGWLLFATVLDDVAGHVQQHLAHMAVVDLVEDMLGMAHALDQAGAAEQSQMVADQRLRELQALGDVANRRRALHAAQHDPQARGIAQEAKGLGKDGHIIL